MLCLSPKEEWSVQDTEVLCDHSNVFRDADDRPVITFSPYHIGIDNIEVPGYEVEISDLSLYGDGARTIVMRQK